MIDVDPDAAIIPRTKLRDYLLSPRHPIGRFKSAFFLLITHVAQPMIQARSQTGIA